MPRFRTRVSNFIAFLFIIALSSVPYSVFSQVTLKGIVTYKNNGAPAVFASVAVLSHKNIQTMTNVAGVFSLNIANSKGNDTLVISSVGYQSIRMPLHIAAKRSEFVLSEVVTDMEGVTVFNSHQVIGSISESVGFYRSWRHENTGGEIGRIFHLPYKKFKIDKIRFKAGNLCDTCLLRVRIRKVIDGVPGDEILTDSISMFVNHLSLDTKIPEFDLTPYDLTFGEKDFFVGIEVLNCGNGNKGFCAFNFAGTEKGEYLYKSGPTSEWQSKDDDYTIYLKLFLRY